MWEGVPVVYTDGACSSNGRVGAAAGIGVYWGEQHVDNVSEPLLNGLPTNNRAELTAVIRAVQTVIFISRVSILIFVVLYSGY